MPANKALQEAGLVIPTLYPETCDFINGEETISLSSLYAKMITLSLQVRKLMLGVGSNTDLGVNEPLWKLSLGSSAFRGTDRRQGGSKVKRGSGSLNTSVANLPS